MYYIYRLVDIGRTFVSFSHLPSTVVDADSGVARWRVRSIGLFTGPQGARGAWFTNEVWDTLERCWNPISSERPRIKDVLQRLESASKSWTPPSQTAAGLLETDPFPHNPDSSGEESTGECEVSSPSQLVSPIGAVSHDLGVSVENPNGPDSEEPTGILDAVSWAGLLYSF